MGRSGEHVERIVISGPNGDGQWFWRLVDGDATRPVPPDLVDPDWRAGHIVEWRVRGTELIGPPAPPEAPLVTLDGQPLDLPDTIEIKGRIHNQSVSLRPNQSRSNNSSASSLR